MNNAMMELLKSAVYFGMRELCHGFLDMPCGCDGCPLYDEENRDEDGDNMCYEAHFKKFLNEHRDMIQALGL